MIAVISHPQDAHASRVIDHLRQEGHSVFLMNLADLPHAAHLTIEYLSNGQPQIDYHSSTDGTVDLMQVHAVWWRRPQAPNLTMISSDDVRLFTANEWQEAINGLWQLLGARWMNPPARDEIASRKALQLRIASESGLCVPRTLITSDPDKARTFITSQGLGKTIYKTFSCTHAIWRETRLVRQEDLALLDTVRLAPVIFQQYVPAEADLRITVIGDRVFSAAIYAGKTDYPFDFRMSLGQATTQAEALPDKVQDSLLRLMKRLGLVYGACDMRRTPDGEYVFLEVNTAGEFLFVEERTGQPISHALADWLSTPV